VKEKLANGVGSQYSHATSERGLSSITQAVAHTSAASSRLNWRPHRFKWIRPFRGKANSGFCACAIMFRTSYTSVLQWVPIIWVSIICFLTYTGPNVWRKKYLKNSCTFEYHIFGTCIFQQKMVSVHFLANMGPNYWGHYAKIWCTSGDHIPGARFFLQPRMCVHHFLPIFCSW